MQTDSIAARLIPSLADLAPEMIQKRIGALMCRYVRVRSPLTASVVARYLEALCRHPGFFPPEEERCIYRRLAREWRCLAERSRTSDRRNRPTAISGRTASQDPVLSANSSRSSAAAEK